VSKLDTERQGFRRFPRLAVSYMSHGCHMARAIAARLSARYLCAMQPQPESSADAPPPHRRRGPPVGYWRQQPNRRAEERQQAALDAERRRRTLEIIARYDALPSAA
jgi:hypothetical protein